MKLKQCVGQALGYMIVVTCFLAATWWGSQAVTVISQEIPLEREHTIVIDAGHGGEDGGAVSCTGVAESGINLQIAVKLNDLLHLLGKKTRMIRTSDVSVYTSGSNLAQKKVSDLKERVRIVNETENPVLISIHQNTFSDPRYGGAQTFYSAAGESRALGEDLQDRFCNALNPESNRLAKSAEGIYLMEKTACTAVLVECGFLSNPREEAMLRTGEYQQKIACVIATGVADHLDRQTND